MRSGWGTRGTLRDSFWPAEPVNGWNLRRRWPASLEHAEVMVAKLPSLLPLLLETDTRALHTTPTCVIKPLISRTAISCSPGRAVSRCASMIIQYRRDWFSPNTCARGGATTELVDQSDPSVAAASGKRLTVTFTFAPFAFRTNGNATGFRFGVDRTVRVGA